MSSLVEIGLFNAAGACLLAVVAAGVGKVSRRPALVHALWMLVLLKLVSPPFFRIPIASSIGWEAARVETIQIRPKADLPPGLAEQELDKENLATGRRPAHTTLTAVAVDDASPAAALSAGLVAADTLDLEAGSGPLPVGAMLKQLSWGPESWMPLVMAVWLAGSILWFTLTAVRIYLFSRSLRNAKLGSLQLQNQARQLAHSMGLARCPDVWIVQAPISPMLWAAGPFTRLLFPAKLFDRLGEDARATILAHELAHFRRCDHWVRVLELFAIGLYWWNPVAWCARRKIQEAEEECCDAWVVMELPAANRSYAEALLDTVDFLSEARPALPPVASGIGHFQSIRKRLTTIMGRTTPRALSNPGRSAVSVLAAVVLPVLPTLADPASHQTVVSQASLEDGEQQPGDTVKRSWSGAEEARVEDLEAIEDEKALASHKRPTTHPTQIAEIWGLAYSPDGKKVIMARADGSVVLSEIATGQVVDLSEYQVTSVAFAPDSKTFATSSWDATVRLWDSDSGRQLAILRGHSDRISSVVFSPDGKTLASGGWDRTLRLWNVATRQEVVTLPELELPINCVRFSPDGKMLAVATGNWKTIEPGQVKMWDLPRLTESATLLCESSAAAIAFSPDARLLAVGHWDGTAKLWDVVTCSARATILVGKDLISHAAFSSGRQMVTPANDHETAELWELFTPGAMARVGLRQEQVATLP